MQIRRLHHHKLGNPTGATFYHGSIIGIMQYFQGRFRPDITFAVNLVVNTPKAKNLVTELEQIGTYLLKTSKDYLQLTFETKIDYRNLLCCGK